MLSKNTFLIRNRVLRKSYGVIKSKSCDYIERCQVFQVDPPFVNININDVEDCFASCKGDQTYQQRAELFYSRGLDYYKVFKYYDYVKTLNKIYRSNDSVNNFYDNSEPSIFMKLWVCLRILFHWLKLKQ